MTQPPIDLAIVGVPKSGTSALYSWLAAHPGVQGSEPKETLYFVERSSSFFVYTGAEASLPTFDEEGWEGFERFFLEPRDGRLRLEATPSNLYHLTPLEAFAGLDPQPLIVTLLRDPAEQIRSAFFFAQNSGASGNFVDTSLTFSAYVEALLEGNLEPLKDAIPHDSLRWYLGAILDQNRYVEWLDRWAAGFSSGKLMPLRFDDLVNSPRELLATICDRAGIDASFYEDYEFSRVHPTPARPPGRTRQLAVTAARHIPHGKVRATLRSAYRHLPAGRSIGEASADETAAMVALGEYFAPYNRVLAEHYPLDVSAWWPERPAAPPMDRVGT